MDKVFGYIYHLYKSYFLVKSPYVRQLTVLSFITSSFFSLSLSAAELRVAVASNFSQAIKELASRFEDKTTHNIKLIFGATGRHYAQIKNGAPFDIFFAADSRRPELLENEGLAQQGSRFTYALGTLVLWSAESDLVDAQGEILLTDSFNHLALANPKLAPYGLAAKEVLQKQRLWQKLKPKMVRGENIAQTFQFVKSGNAELGFVAFSHVKSSDPENQGSLWFIPKSQYSAIEQQAVIINPSKVASEFVQYVKGKEGRDVIKRFGYGLSNDK